jgi:hypothetical protein
MEVRYKFPALPELPAYISKQMKYEKRKLPMIRLENVIYEVT